ncbi:TRAP transporter large permease [Halalkalibacter alkaliphilus]|uniref:TRAP transporter large permease subunit n=1 Tax=Halalkalibacter alkaliphilus TaxID=2917993 RepID=A0A9X2I833_9BACI|nr:TRAP transporter large permease subunit [Halalkalibacter alkaliphilus]
MSTAIFLITLLGSILLGIPVAFALLVSGISLMFFLDIMDTQNVARSLINGAGSFTLLAVPFFILAGQLMNYGGISNRIVNFALALFGHVRGGLGYVAILGSILFAGLSGSAVADTAALGAILIPMMVKAGYDRNRSTGLIAGGGIIAPIIPPSIPMIIFGVTSGVSILQLFMAGIVPGLMLGLGLAVAWSIMVRKDKVDVLPRKSMKEILKATQQAVWALFLPVIIIVGLRGGVFTPTEAGVIASFYALFVGAIIYRELKMPELYKALIETVKITSVVMFLYTGAMVLGWGMTVANIPSAIAGLLEPFSDNQFLLLLLIVLFTLLIGTAMDLTAIILILTPILMPIIQMAGIDPVYFGVVFILAACLGMLTPPVGTVLVVASGVGKISMENMLRGVWPFLLVHIIVLLLLILFPAIVTVPLEWLMK